MQRGSDGVGNSSVSICSARHYRLFDGVSNISYYRGVRRTIDIIPFASSRTDGVDTFLGESNVVASAPKTLRCPFEELDTQTVI